MSPSDQEVIARTFAPVLVFHPDEDFFPLNSRDGVAAGDDPEGVRDRVAKLRRAVAARSSRACRRRLPRLLARRSWASNPSSSNTGVTTSTTRTPCASDGFRIARSRQPSGGSRSGSTWC